MRELAGEIGEGGLRMVEKRAGRRRGLLDRLAADLRARLPVLREEGQRQRRNTPFAGAGARRAEGGFRVVVPRTRGEFCES